MRATKSLSVRTVAVIGAVAAVVAGSVVGTAATAHAAPGSCPSLYVVAIPGTWETGVGEAPKPGMLTAVTNAIDGGNIETDYVTYPATAFPWEGDAYGASEAQAVANASGLLKAKADACPGTRFGIIGYSQGADAAGDLAASIGTGAGIVPADKIAAVGLISDPKRSDTDALVGPKVVGSGVGGPRIGGFGYVSPVTRTFCAVGDLYCSTPREDFVARLAGFLAVSSDPTPSAIGKYVSEAQALLADLSAVGGLPALAGQLTDQANEDRVEQIQTFYRSQVHTDYRNYRVDPNGATATSWLANYLRDAA
ncbi:hypothetical protein GCM10007304_01240 [Rhodococcoides trifolii]|uniref:Cutinase n=1 Tax=Rhodococcoides trifolii TaxID=908250 RepID=A0A917CJS2_9NOCA|nr:cutinase family protein [Rhodococcus trifolii]GGF91042.1 hypothetical protein GCM10007304_01240 [Rhodococcus trifolii]